MWNVIHQRGLLTHEPNELRILRVVREGAISRVEIARATNLHKTTVTHLVAKLIRSGFLEDTGEVEARNRVGRKRILLKFRPMAGIVAGVDIRMTRATVALCDLNAGILVQDSYDYSVTDSAVDVLSRAGATIKALLKSARLAQSKLVGIGVGVQGIIDCATNTLVLSYNKKSWQGESLGAPLEAEFSVPVYVENDVKTMALGEYLLGMAKGKKNFFHIWVGEGVGAGIIINGQLLHGITSSAGEIGYNVLDCPPSCKEKFPLTFRDQLMFGEILTDANLIESYRRAAPQQTNGDITVASIAERARLGDSTAQQLIEEFTTLLSVLCINMVNALNPELILIGGQVAQNYPAIAEMLQAKIHGDLLTPPAEAVRVRTASNTEHGVIVGAAGLVLYELFEPLHRVSARSPRRHGAVKPHEVEAVG